MLDLFKSIEGVYNLKEEYDQGIKGGKVKFNYLDYIDGSYYTVYKSHVLTLCVCYDSKLFMNGKIKKLFRDWQLNLFGITKENTEKEVYKYYLSVMNVTNVGNAHVFTILMMDETKELFEKVLKLFDEDFLPSIKQYIKGDFILLEEADSQKNA